MTETVPVTVAPTGATGFMGSALARARAHWGYRVRALTRRPPIAYQSRVGVEWIHGELTDPAALDTRVAAADVCFHFAAMLRTAGPAAAFRRTNPDCTAQLLQSAKADACYRREGLLQ